MILSIYYMISFIGLTFVYMTHPLTMGLVIIIETLLICLIIGLYSINSWYSYILFLVFLGGLLVLFIYISSLAENELFLFQNKWLVKSFYMSLLFMIMMFILFTVNMSFYTIDMNQALESFNTQYYFLSTHFYSEYESKITLFLGLYLLFSLLIVTKICQLNKGPMRQKF